jgi:hypothetical protein
MYISDEKVCVFLVLDRLSMGLYSAFRVGLERKIDHADH